MNHEKIKEGEKKTYEKPKLATIELAADEVLFIECKLASGGFAFDASPCPANFCTQNGSWTPQSSKETVRLKWINSN